MCRTDQIKLWFVKGTLPVGMDFDFEKELRINQC